MKLSQLFTRKKSILIVEDDTTLRVTLAEKFKGADFRVLEARSSTEVLSLLGTERPDVLLLDLILPAKDGISLLEELRATGFEQPVIILSNLLGSEELRADAERLHATYYNKSAVSLDEIVDAVRRVL